MGHSFVDYLQVFVAQFSIIYLLGFQQMNVAGKHYIAAAFTSLLIGIAGFYIQSVIAGVRLEGLYTTLWYTYIFSGPMGIVLAMKTHPFIKRKFFKK